MEDVHFRIHLEDEKNCRYCFKCAVLLTVHCGRAFQFCGRSHTHDDHDMTSPAKCCECNETIGTEITL